MSADTYTLPDDHHPIALRAKALWEKSGALTAMDLAAIEADYSALIAGEFDELRDAAASLASVVVYLHRARDSASAEALHEIILTARARFERWRSEQAVEKVEPRAVGVRAAPMFGEKGSAGSVSLKALMPNVGLDRARLAAGARTARRGPPGTGC